MANLKDVQDIMKYIEELTDEELKNIDVLDDMAMLSDLVSSKKA